jgi:hypothetical protein
MRSQLLNEELYVNKNKENFNIKTNFQKIIYISSLKIKRMMLVRRG